MPDPKPQPTPDPTPSGEFRLMGEIERQDVIVEEQTLAGRKVLAAVFAEPWREWIDAFAAHVQLEPKDLIKQALAVYAMQAGFDKNPPR